MTTSIQNFAQGWNTWNTRSVLSHVLLPEAMAINLAFKDGWHPAYLKEALIGDERRTQVSVMPGPRTFEGSYTSLRLEWQSIKATVESGHDGEDLLLLVSPELVPGHRAMVVVESGLLWNRPGSLERQGDSLVLRSGERTVTVHATATPLREFQVACQTPFLVLDLGDGPVGICTGRRRSLAEIRTALNKRQAEVAQRRAAYGDQADVYDAVQRVQAWNVLYEPDHQRVCSPVSRVWNHHLGGWSLFCWDTFFGAQLQSLECQAVAQANALAMLEEATDEGFVPCWSFGTGAKSLDRSNPPVGSFAVKSIYRRFRDRAFLEQAYGPLLRWNRWWESARLVDGFLRLGSHPYTPKVGHWEEKNGVGQLLGSLFEAALDNSPMYDGVGWDERSHTQELADVGLTSLLALDSDSLADLAQVLGRSEDEAELRARGDRCRAILDRLWDEQAGIYRNWHTDRKEASQRISPTSLYPLFAGIAKDRAHRLVQEHLLNPAEFWTEWAIPTITANDPAFPEQVYWRGKIWPPMNWLIYVGCRMAGETEAATAVAAKSSAVLLKEWREHGHVHENYTATTGMGCDKEDSDRFHHWGGLLGLPALIEAGFMEGPEMPLAATGSRTSSASAGTTRIPG